MRRFGRRFGRTRRFAGRRRTARRLGAYELLFEDTDRGSVDGGVPPGHVLGFPVGVDGVISAGTIPTQELPALPQQTTAVQAVRVTSEGFTAAIPLWDVSLDTKWQQDCSMSSLRGYLRPTRLAFENSGSNFANIIMKVRLAIVMSNISVLEAGMGDVSSTFPLSIWSRSGQQMRILWQRDWYMPNNNSAGTDYQYWAQGGRVDLLSRSSGNEPRLATNNGSESVRLRRVGRIVRGRWPLLLVGVKGMPFVTGAGGTVAVAASGTVTLQDDVDLSVRLQGYLRAYIQR